MTMKMAKADEKDYGAVCKLLSMIEQAIEYGVEWNSTDDTIEIESGQLHHRLGELIDEWYHKSPGGAAERVVHGGWVMIENACDPDLDYLDWKPELKALIGEKD